jgi:hypothetical protein
VAGPLADDPSGLAALIEAAVARTPAGTQLQLKPLEPALDGLAPGVVGHPWRLTYILKLPEHPQELRFGNSRNHSAIKRAVTKAHRNGVRVRPASTLGDLRSWYALYLDTMRHHVVPPRPLRLFVAFWEEMRPLGTMRLLIAERGDELLAGCVTLQFGSTVFYGFNGVRRDALEHRPNDAIHWEAIHTACAEGFKAYDFGEVVERHAGLARFKAKWGTEPRRLHRYYHPAPEQPPTTGDPDQGPLGRAATAVWKRTPLPATAIAGDLAYRFL